MIDDNLEVFEGLDFLEDDLDLEELDFSLDTREDKRMKHHKVPIWRTIISIHAWSVWLATWGGRKFSFRVYLESFIRISRERFYGRWICRHFGHKWTNHPDEPYFSTCSRCKISDLYD